MEVNTECHLTLLVSLLLLEVDRFLMYFVSWHCKLLLYRSFVQPGLKVYTFTYSGGLRGTTSLDLSFKGFMLTVFITLRLLFGPDYKNVTLPN